jgi:hypothetical protein
MYNEVFDYFEANFILYRRARDGNGYPAGHTRCGGTLVGFWPRSSSGQPGAAYTIGGMIL